MMLRTSYYVRGSGISYLDYLQGQQYVDDIKYNNNLIAFDVKRNLRELIASNQLLEENLISIKTRELEQAQENNERLREKDAVIRDMQQQSSRMSEQVNEGFERVSYSLDDISDSFRNGLKALGGKFSWACNNLLAGMEHMQDSLNELKNLVKNPMMTAGLEHFEAARSNFRRKLYGEALDELDAAINGVPGVSAGNKTEWRFHQLVGTIRLGFVGCDSSLVDLAEAEQSYLLAARYAELDYPQEAATAYLSAGWAAYCNGNLDSAVLHLKKAVELEPELGEAWYLLGKTYGAKNDATAFNYLRKAAFIDPIYKLKAIGDKDYTYNEKGLLHCFELINNDYYMSYVRFINRFLRTKAEYLAVKGLESEVERICISNVLKSRESFDKDFRQFKENLEKYVKERNQLQELLEVIHLKIKTLTEVIAHPDFSLWKIGNPIANYQARYKVLQTEFIKNDYCNKMWNTFGSIEKKLSDDVNRYQAKLSNAVEKFYNSQLHSIDGQINDLKRQIERKKAFLKDDSEVATTSIKGGLSC